MMNSIKPYLLTFCLLLSSLFFTMLGGYWNQEHYHESDTFSLTEPPLAMAMMGLHDGLLLQMSEPEPVPDEEPVSDEDALLALESIPSSTESEEESQASQTEITENSTALAPIMENVGLDGSKTYSFTPVSEDYFDDAVFIGDSRTVGISEYSGIENATFLCKTSLSIYDYTKPKITYKNKKTSIQEVLQNEAFGKIYLMVGINESGCGTPESFYQLYRDVVEDIRRLQPDSLIFIEGNLLVTQSKSDSNTGITNENIASRNDLIATLANQQDTFYIDINQSSLCSNGALLPEFTWDQVHIKAQYYEVWKDFLLKHGIVKNTNI